MGATEGFSDPILTRIAEEDKVKWYKKPNLRLMYIFLFICCMGIEITSGFDSTLIGTLQFSKPWNKCKSSYPSSTVYPMSNLGQTFLMAISTKMENLNLHLHFLVSCLLATNLVPSSEYLLLRF